MKKLLLICALALSLFACGNRITDAEDNTRTLLIGMWDSVINTPDACHERIRLNNDGTFWWYKEGKIATGNWARGSGRDENRLNFMFTAQAWEMVKFTVSDRDLYVERLGTTKLFVRVPVSLANTTSSLCPAEKRSRN